MQMYSVSPVSAADVCGEDAKIGVVSNEQRSPIIVLTILPKNCL